mgnify:CR=1 FL=1
MYRSTVILQYVHNFYIFISYFLRAKSHFVSMRVGTRNGNKQGWQRPVTSRWVDKRTSSTSSFTELNIAQSISNRTSISNRGNFHKYTRQDVPIRSRFCFLNANTD